MITTVKQRKRTNAHETKVTMTGITRSDVGVGVDVAMGVMVGVASKAVNETVVAARKETQECS